MTAYEHERSWEITAVPPVGGELFAVRGFGYAEVHLAIIPASSVMLLWRGRMPFRAGAESPVAGLCGSRVRSAHPYVMLVPWKPRRQSAETVVSCRHCVRRFQAPPVDTSSFFGPDPVPEEMTSRDRERFDAGLTRLGLQDYKVLPRD